MFNRREGTRRATNFFPRIGEKRRARYHRRDLVPSGASFFRITAAAVITKDLGLQERLAKLVGGVAIIKVGAATETEMKEKKARVEDAMHATKAAVEEGIVPGGGVALLRASEALQQLKLEGDEQVGVNINRSDQGGPLSTATPGVDRGVAAHDRSGHHADSGKEQGRGHAGRRYLGPWRPLYLFCTWTPAFSRISLIGRFSLFRLFENSKDRADRLPPPPPTSLRSV